MTAHLAALDQGTTSTRCIVFDDTGSPVASAQREHAQIMPRSGWVEHDPLEIRRNAEWVLAEAIDRAGLRSGDLTAVGITSQRETTVAWDRRTGEPVCNAIVWQDTRTDALCRQFAGSDADRYRDRVGLPLATYFSGPKIAWILAEVPGARAAAERGDLLVGTVDSWLIWCLTGGLHVTDVTNASRTMLMDLRSLRWDSDIASEMGVPLGVLPEIRSSAEEYGRGASGTPIAGVPICGNLGDQQAAMLGQVCVDPGNVKNTYGTGNFMLVNTGTEPVLSRHGLLTTVCGKLGDAAPTYALEGSIAVTGSLVQWLRDNLGVIEDAAQVESLASSVDDNGGVYFVPAFSGLFAPHWRTDARGVIAGLTRFAHKGHLARAVLEATAFQTLEVLEAMDADCDAPIRELKVDGGMVRNQLLMQFQADLLDIPIVRPVVTETTALGAAYAAGLAAGVWSGTDELRTHWAEDTRWEPSMKDDVRDELRAGWTKAVQRSLAWVD